MKRFLQIALLLATGLSLSACGNLKNSDLANNPTTSTTKKKSYQTTSTSKNGYNVLLKDGEFAWLTGCQWYWVYGDGRLQIL